jgi:hypothetical protein
MASVILSRVADAFFVSVDAEVGTSITDEDKTSLNGTKTSSSPCGEEDVFFARADGPPKGEPHAYSGS